MINKFSWFTGFSQNLSGSLAATLILAALGALISTPANGLKQERAGTEKRDKQLLPKRSGNATDIKPNRRGAHVSLKSPRVRYHLSITLKIQGR